jgi:hypothetical protein
MSYETHIINAVRMGKPIMRYETHINNGVRTGEGYNKLRSTHL